MSDASRAIAGAMRRALPILFTARVIGLATLPVTCWVLGGAMNCGKAQPGQIAAVSHGCPSARFRGVNVLNTREEGR